MPAIPFKYRFLESPDENPTMSLSLNVSSVLTEGYTKHLQSFTRLLSQCQRAYLMFSFPLRERESVIKRLLCQNCNTDD